MTPSAHADTQSLKEFRFRQLVSRTAHLVPQASGLMLVMVLRTLASAAIIWWALRSSDPHFTLSSPGYFPIMITSLGVLMLLTVLSMCSLNGFIRDLVAGNKADFSSAFHWRGLTWSTVKGQMLSWGITAVIGTLGTALFCLIHYFIYGRLPTFITSLSSIDSRGLTSLKDFDQSVQLILMVMVFGMVIGLPYQYVRTLVGLGARGKEGRRQSLTITGATLHSQGWFYLILLVLTVVGIIFSPFYPIVIFILLIAKYLSMAVVYTTAYGTNASE